MVMLDRLRQVMRNAANPDSPFGGCLVYGKDDFLYTYLDRGLRLLVERGRTLERYDCGQVPFRDFLVTAAAPSFFAADKIVHLENFSAWSRKEHEKFIAWLERDAAPGPVSWIFISSRKLTGNRFPLTSLKKLLTVIKSDRPRRPAEAARLLAPRLRKLQVEVAPRILEELVELHDNDLLMVEQELEKMSLYVGPGGCIDQAVVELLGVDGGSGNIFKFCDALSEGRTVAALEILHAILRARVEALLIIALVARQYRLLLRAADPACRKLSAEALARELKVQPFVARKLKQQVAGRPPRQWSRVFARLSQVDKQLKSSKLPPAIILEQLVMDLSCDHHRQRDGGQR